MSRMSQSRRELYKLVDELEASNRGDYRDSVPLASILDELMFEADLRFKDYLQFREEGDYPARLLRFLKNVPRIEHRKVLLELARLISFVDRRQMLALHRDAYRRIIMPWLLQGLGVRQLLSPSLESDCIELLRHYQLCSITESFGIGDFLHVNDLLGLPKMKALGEDLSIVREWLSRLAGEEGFVVLEDFVGTGKQAARVLREIAKASPNASHIFVPLAILARGLRHLRRTVKSFTIAPVLVIPETDCLPGEALKSESELRSRVRAVVRQTARQVLAKHGKHDDPPRNEFGYKGCGSLLVTCYNVPNNTLPLIHHRSPNWRPIFRRLHHSKDSLR